MIGSAMIQEFADKQKARMERREKRLQQPREHLRRRRAESLERAAYNEYQAKLLDNPRRFAQRQAVLEKIDRQSCTSALPG